MPGGHERAEDLVTQGLIGGQQRGEDVVMPSPMDFFLSYSVSGFVLTNACLSVFVL